jgi:hypothetical protein
MRFQILDTPAGIRGIDLGHDAVVVRQVLNPAGGMVSPEQAERRQDEHAAY